MSFTTILGVLFGFGLFAVAVALATDNPFVFFSGLSFLIVFGGTLASAFIGFQARYVLLALKEVGGAFLKAKVDRNTLTVETGKIIRWGYLVKKHGILALEREIKGAKNQDHFLNYGGELVITGYSGDARSAPCRTRRPTASTSGPWCRSICSPTWPRRRPPSA